MECKMNFVKSMKGFILLMVSFSLLFSASTLFGGISPKEGEEYLAFAEQMPAPIGGLPAIYKNIKYPAIAQSAGIQGKVYLLVFVKEDGAVGDIKIVKSLGGGCDEAAMEAIKKAKFAPGKNKGKEVKVKFTMAIEFKLS